MFEADQRPRYRGYIVSRPISGVSYPQRIQNLAVRDLARRIGVDLSFSLTEYAMPKCYMMQKELINTIESADGIIFFSLFTLTPDRAVRNLLFRRAIGLGRPVYFALENLSITKDADRQLVEDLLAIANALPSSPFAGRYEKTAKSGLDAVDMKFSL
jgi:sporadic carbohydrate cluster protein (TIGR04323 family)